MHLKRCAVQPDLDDAGRPKVRRRVTADLKRYLVIEDALVTFGNLSREFRANVLVHGTDIDAMIDVLDAGEIVMATMVVDDGGDGDLPTVYTLTNAVQDARPRHVARRAA